MTWLRCKAFFLSKKEEVLIFLTIIEGIKKFGIPFENAGHFPDYAINKGVV